MRVLVIDDDSMAREIVRDSLEGEGDFEVSTRINAQDTLRSVPSPPPDVILLDVAMPEMGGFELLSRLKELPVLAEVPVILVTARAGRLTQNDVRAAGAVGLITKPVQPQQLPIQIRGMLSR